MLKISSFLLLNPFPAWSRQRRKPLGLSCVPSSESLSLGLINPFMLFTLYSASLPPNSVSLSLTQPLAHNVFHSQVTSGALLF